MPVTVQLPGYRSHEAPISALAGLVNTGANVYHSYKQGQLADTEQQSKLAQLPMIQAQTQVEQLKLADAQRAADYQKNLADANTNESKSALNDLIANVAIHKEMGRKAGLSEQSLAPFDQILEAAKNGYATEKPLPQGVEGPHQALSTPMTGIDATRAKDSPLFKGIEGAYDSKLKADAAAAMAAPRWAGVENQKDRIAASAADHFDKDPILTKITKQKQQVDLDKHTLETAQTLTPQIINEIQQGIANAISGGGSAGLGKTEQTEIQTAKQKIAELKQRFTSDPTPVNDPQLVQYFHGVLDRLGQAYDKNGYTRAQQILNGRSQGYKNNPAAVEVMRDKAESYKPQESQPAGQAGYTPTPDEAAAELKRRGVVK